METGAGQSVMTVGEFLSSLNEILESQSASVLGEVTGAHPHQTGFYFSLKDKEDGSIMDCYMSPFAYRGLGFTVQDGMEAKVGGMPAIYKPKGRFSFRVETIELAGEGSLKKAYELLKQQLDGEGLFARKRPLPGFISRIGIITSRTGAVIDDFRKNLQPLGLQLYLKDVRVEGARAADNIIKAIKFFQTFRPNAGPVRSLARAKGASPSDLGEATSNGMDVLVLIRGGGSLEDLQAFNNEHVVRAVFSSDIPTICGIGHDRDIPIVSLAGDVAPSTPTAAAMLVNASWDPLVRALPEYAGGLSALFQSALDDYRDKIALDSVLPVFQNALTQGARLVDSGSRYLESVDPARNLRLGYSIVTDSRGHVVKTADDVAVGDDIGIRLSRGNIVSNIKSIKKS